MASSWISALRSPLVRLTPVWQHLRPHLASPPSTDSSSQVETLLERCQGRTVDSQAQVLAALRELIALDYGALEPCLLEALKHPAPAVRQLALEALDPIATDAARSPLLVHFAGEFDPDLQALSIALLCRIAGPTVETELQPLLKSAQEPVQRAALVGLLNHGGLNSSQAALGQIQALLSSADPAQRRRGIAVLGEAGIQRYYGPLLTALEDADPEVRQAALTAARRLRPPALVLPLLAALAQPTGYQPIAQALAAQAKHTLPLLADTLEESQTQAHRHRLVRVLGALPQTEALDLLATQLEYPDALIRREVLHTLVRRAHPPSPETLHQQLREEASQIIHGLRALEDLAEGPIAVPLSPLGWPGWPSQAYQVDLVVALETDLQQARERLLLMLQLLDQRPDVTEALTALEPGHPRRESALARLERSVPGDSRHLVMPLLRLSTQELTEPRIRRQLLAGLRERFRSDTLATTLHALNQRSRLSALASRPLRYSSLWSRLCALCVLAHQPGSGIPGELLGPARNPGPIVLRETALGLLFRHHPDTAGRVLETLTHDPEPRIAALVQRLIHGSDRIMLLELEKAIILGNTRLFSGTTYEQRLALASIAQEQRLSRDAVLLQPGEPRERLFVVVEGSVQVDIPGVPPFRRGAVVDELPVLGKRASDTTVRALEDTLLLGIAREPLLALMAEHREVMEAVVMRLCEGGRSGW